jgi:hypothetical protein
VGVLIVLRLTGVLEIPTRWLVVAVVVDIALALVELAVLAALARAFVEGSREGGVLTGYERAIDTEERLGLPRPLVAAMRAEVWLYRAIARLFRRR